MRGLGASCLGGAAAFFGSHLGMSNWEAGLIAALVTVGSGLLATGRWSGW